MLTTTPAIALAATDIENLTSFTAAVESTGSYYKESAGAAAARIYSLLLSLDECETLEGQRANLESARYAAKITIEEAQAAELALNEQDLPVEIILTAQAALGAQTSQARIVLEKLNKLEELLDYLAR